MVSWSPAGQALLEEGGSLVFEGCVLLPSLWVCPAVNDFQDRARFQCRSICSVGLTIASKNVKIYHPEKEHVLPIEVLQDTVLMARCIQARL